MKPGFLVTLSTLPVLLAAPAVARDDATCGDPAVAVRAINTLGFEILRAAYPAENNAVLSPYSIEVASAMAYAGAEGKTRKEMATTLHYPGEESLLHSSLAGLTDALEQMTGRGEVTLTLTNQLYAAKGHSFRESFLGLLKNTYRSSLVSGDVVKGAGGVVQGIDTAGAKQAGRSSPDPIAPGPLADNNALEILNEVYLKATWLNVFPKQATKPRPFAARNRQFVNAPTMTVQADFGYWKRVTFSVIALRYSDGYLQFLIFLPERGVSLQNLERTLTTADLTNLTDCPETSLILYLPKFKLTPATLSLSETLSHLGLKSAFIPGEADFRRMDSGRDLYIARALHKAYLTIDEQGTEAGATTVFDFAEDLTAPLPPLEVHVDRPFLFAVQHIPSGAFLFIGRVTDPR
jgi:serpin B